MNDSATIRRADCSGTYPARMLPLLRVSIWQTKNRRPMDRPRSGRRHRAISGVVDAETLRSLIGLAGATAGGYHKS